MSFEDFYLCEAMRTSLHPDSNDRRKVIEIVEEWENFSRFSFYKSRDKFMLGSGTIGFNKYDGYWSMHPKLSPGIQHKGFGPLIYDVVIEYVTNYKKSMLIPAINAYGGDTSADAEAVYKYYYLNRGDVEKHELDNLKQSAKSKLKPWLYTGYTKPLQIIPQMLANKTLIISNSPVV